ncbi:MAG: response regulator, partial [Acidobacteriota bacterium]
MTKQPIILVVDDEPQILRAMRASLPASGYEVRTAQSGEEALDEIRKETPDLIILDLVMPDITGLDVCRRVREFSTVPIIVLSAKGAEQDKIIALDLGADDYVTKPFSLNELLARIRAVLRRISPSDSTRHILTVGDLKIYT